MLDRLEQRLGLPPLREVSDIFTESKLKQLNTLLTKLEKLSRDLQMVKELKELLKIVMDLDNKGTLTRLNLLLEELGPLTKGKTAAKLVEKLDKLEKLISALLKEE